MTLDDKHLHIMHAVLDGAIEHAKTAGAEAHTDEQWQGYKAFFLEKALALKKDLPPARVHMVQLYQDAKLKSS